MKEILKVRLFILLTACVAGIIAMGANLYYFWNSPFALFIAAIILIPTNVGIDIQAFKTWKKLDKLI